MRGNRLWTALLALSLPGSGCQPCCEAPGAAKATPTAANAGRPGCCPQVPKGSSAKVDCCATPKAVAQPGDSARQIVFQVAGLTCPAVKGIGCGHRIAPVLERLDKIDGVEASSANGTGTRIRIVVKAGADREKVAEAVRKDLAADKRDPARIAGDELAKALKDEEWRGIDRIGQLSATEFRKLNLDRVKAFAAEEKLNEDVAGKLLELAPTVWDRLVQSAEIKEGKRPPHRTDWAGRCGEFAKVLTEQSKDLLTADQRDRLGQSLTSRFAQRP